jgi:hypothetical protein
VFCGQLREKYVLVWHEIYPINVVFAMNGSITVMETALSKSGGCGAVITGKAAELGKNVHCLFELDTLGCPCSL